MTLTTPVACLVRQMSLVDKGNWSHHQWNMLLIQSRFTCPVRAWSIMLLKHLRKSSLGPSPLYNTWCWLATRCQGRCHQSCDPEEWLSRWMDGLLFCSSCCLWSGGRWKADNGLAGGSHGMTDYSTSSAALHHLLPNPFACAILPLSQLRWIKIEGEQQSTRSIVVQQRRVRLITLKYPSLECWQHPAWHINHI